MKAALKYFATAVMTIAMAVAVVISCNDYGAQIQELDRQLAALEAARDEAQDAAKGLGSLIAALQSENELVSFEPIAGEDGVSGFRVVFSQAGEIVIYNRSANISVGAENGKYYWMSGDKWLTDAVGKRIEINPETPVPQFRVANGGLEVSVDGGTVFHQLGKIDRCLIEAVTEDAAKVVFTLAGGATITIPKPGALKLSLTGDQTSIGAGESITVAYSVEGAEDADITVLCGDGWSAVITPGTATEGTIEITAPTPVTEDEVIVFASDGFGRMVAVRVRLAIDASGNPVQPDPETVLRPVITAYDVTKEGGEAVVPMVTNVDYAVTTDAPWLIYAGTKAERTDHLLFTVLPNDDLPRAAVATITSGIYSTAVAFSQAGEVRRLELSASDMSFGTEGGSKILTVTSNIDYTFDVSDDWVSVARDGTLSDYIVTVGANPTTQYRMATVTFSGERVPTRVLEIIQAGQEPYLTVSGGPFSFDCSGGSGTLIVYTNVELSYGTSADWITISGGGEGGGHYVVTAAANTGFDARNAIITFSGEGVESKSITVSQAATEPYFTLSSDSFAFVCSGGAEIFTITSNVQYSYAVSGDGWVTVSPVGSTGGRYAIRVDSNASVDSRTATITFTVDRIGSRTVTISQAGQEPFMKVSVGNTVYFDADGGTSGFSVTANVPYTMTVTDSPWLTVVGEPSTGLRFFSVTAPPNAGYVTRTATVTFSSDRTDSFTLQIVQAGSIPPEPGPGVMVEGDVPPALAAILDAGGKVESLLSDAYGMKFYMTGSEKVSFTRSGTLSVTLDDSRAITRGGGKVDIRYHIGGINPASGELYVTVLFYAEGWKATVYPANGAEGIIRLKAPDPATRGGILVMVSDAKGEMAAVQMHLKIEALSSTGPIPISHIMPCCRGNNAGTKFYVDGRWNSYHQYYFIEDTRSILQAIQDAGINTVCIDFTNPSQWDSVGESALHNGDGGEFWHQFKPMLDTIVEVCEEKDMEFIIFFGSPLAAISDLPYWNNIAGRVLDNWAKSPSYRRYGYGDDRPLAVMFCPGTYYTSVMNRAKASDKNNLLQFRIGTCQVNSPITPTATDGWGYRNYSQSNDGKVRFACPNGGVPPQDWYRVDAAEWRRRVDWVMGAAEYAVIGSYDDTCDAIFWGIADVRRSTTDCHRNETTEDDPYVYYNIVRQKLTGME